MKFVVVMPFQPAFDAVYEAIKTSVLAAASPEDPVCLRVDDDLKAGRIFGKIDDHLRSADVCIADITGLNSNVMWEVGFIESMRKPVIAISQTVHNLPFNIKDITVRQYSLDNLYVTLTIPLAEAIRQTLLTFHAQRTRMTVAITGSRSIMPHKAEYCVRTYVSPLLSIDTTWYCGTNGPVDEAAARFLLENRQRLLGVHSITNHVSDEIRAIFEQHNATLYDTDKVALPRAIPDLSWRDAFFVTKADLLILIWDGRSQNIANLRTWLADNGKDHILAFA